MIAVALKRSHKMIGNVYLGKREFEALEIGFVFNRHYWGHGYAAESCGALIRQAFANGVHRIYAECDPCNMHSWKLLETLGFRKEACFRKNVYFCECIPHASPRRQRHSCQDGYGHPQGRGVRGYA